METLPRTPRPLRSRQQKPIKGHMEVQDLNKGGAVEWETRNSQEGEGWADQGNVAASGLGSVQAAAGRAQGFHQ